MRDLITTLEARQAIERYVLEPLRSRGKPPAGWTEEALAADYLDALASFPGAVIERAAATVRLDHTRSTWPLAGEYRRACQALMQPEDRPGAATGGDQRMRISMAAWDYVHRRLAAGTPSLITRAIEGWYLVELRQWLFERACADIRDGRDPHVPDADLEAAIAGWTDAEAGRQARIASTPRPQSDVGLAAHALVARVRASMEAEDAAVVAGLEP